jgi:predicted nucleotidyltransferase
MNALDTFIDSLATGLAKFFEEKPFVLAAYLFGSLIKREKGFKDIDVAVLLYENYLKESAQIPLGLKTVLVTELMGRLKENRIDVTLLNQAPPLLAMEVLRHGRLIHCKDDMQRISAENKLRKKYIDTAHLRRIKRLYLKKKYGGQGTDI